MHPSDDYSKPEVRPTRIEGWGRRAGGFKTPKGERMLKVKRGGQSKGASNSNTTKRFRVPCAKPVKRERKVNGILIDRDDC